MLSIPHQMGLILHIVDVNEIHSNGRDILGVHHVYHLSAGQAINDSDSMDPGSGFVTIIIISSIINYELYRILESNHTESYIHVTA